MQQNTTCSSVHGAAARRSVLLILTGLLLATLAAAGLACSGSDEPLPDAVTFSSPGLYPEGFGYDEGGRRFLVSSITEGDVFAVTPEGDIERFIVDERLIASTGVTVDAARGRVIVATGDVMVSGRSSAESAFVTASVGVYDLETGAARDFFALADLVPGSGHFASEAAVGPAGELYVTDSFAPVIYRVDAGGRGSVFLESPSFLPGMNQFGLNGLVHHPGGYLIAAKSDEGRLFRIPLASPESFAAIEAEAFPGVDGIALDGEDQLLLTINGGHRVVTLESDDDWATAREVASRATPDAFPTMVAAAGGEFFVLHSHLDKLLAGDRAHATYRLEKLAPRP